MTGVQTCALPILRMYLLNFFLRFGLFIPFCFILCQRNKCIIAQRCLALAWECIVKRLLYCYQGIGALNLNCIACSIVSRKAASPIYMAKVEDRFFYTMNRKHIFHHHYYHYFFLLLLPYQKLEILFHKI